MLEVVAVPSGSVLLVQRFLILRSSNVKARHVRVSDIPLQDVERVIDVETFFV
jgi:hypothetical protein